MRSKIIFIVSMFLMGCPSVTETDPLPVVVEREDTDWCDAGCVHLSKMKGQDGDAGCLESRPLVLPDSGAISCAQFCEETQRNGRALSPRCWVEEVTKCDEIESVCRTDLIIKY